jgi:serine phosphatase RsbU (regulator of sigma subunit)/type II secretory pathway pseudopilin PulG
MRTSPDGDLVGRLGADDAAVASTRRGSRRPLLVVASICIVGAVLTGLSTWAAGHVDRNAEERLLQVQTRQAAAVLSTAVLLIQQPMETALSVQSAVGPPGDAAAFQRFMDSNVGPDQLFISATLWLRQADTARRLASAGEPAAMQPDDPALLDFLDHALATPGPVVQQTIIGDQARIVWALADPGSGFVIYAERAIPADRQAPAAQDSAFADLHYAIYLGEQTDLADLSTTDVDPGELPLDGLTHRVTVPFGDTVLTLVTTPRRHLGASLSEQLPFILLVAGLVLTAAAAFVAHQLVRGRRDAEQNTDTITGLYERVDSLYEDQHALFVRLQRALLPQTNPPIPNLEIAAEYVAGSHGVDIGGDWYSVIDTTDDDFAFVVGDVSGSGLDAVAVMARARFTLRAYLVDGQSPSTVLEKCSRQFDISVDEHMTTVVVGVGNWRTGVVTLANAGHPPPLLLASDGPQYVQVPVGPPIGTGPASYESATFVLPVGSSLILYTDGLIERRTDDLDTGMRRLAETARAHASDPLETLVAQVLSDLRDDDVSDDIAILALRRVGP